MKVYVTKYALSQGVLEYDTDRGFIFDFCERADPTGNMLLIRRPGKYDDLYLHGRGKEWHTDAQDAMKDADQRLQRRIKSLEKQIAKIKCTVLTINQR